MLAWKLCRTHKHTYASGRTHTHTKSNQLKWGHPVWLLPPSFAFSLFHALSRAHTPLWPTIKCSRCIIIKQKQKQGHVQYVAYGGAARDKVNKANRHCRRNEAQAGVKGTVIGPSRQQRARCSSLVWMSGKIKATFIHIWFNAALRMLGCSEAIDRNTTQFVCGEDPGLRHWWQSGDYLPKCSQALRFTVTCKTEIVPSVTCRV